LVFQSEEFTMANDNIAVRAANRAKVLALEEYEVRLFAYRQGITIQQTVALINRYGGDRATLDREVAKLH
jgi:hypothetical protein